MESVTGALNKGIQVATKITYTVVKSAILKVVFFLDEEHLELAIEQDVDLLPLFLIYSPQGAKAVRQLAGRAGRGFARQITLPSTLKWLKEQCERRGKKYYDIIVNLPEDAEPVEPGKEVYPPIGHDVKRVAWWWGNVERLTKFFLKGVMPRSSKKWAVEHLRWLKEQEEKGKEGVNRLLKQVADERRKKLKEGKQN